jgi:Pectate lyase superfamily protein
MTKSFSTKRFHLGVATVASETTDPNSSGGTAASMGSLWLRNGDDVSAPTQTFLNLDGDPTGWVLQNLIHLKIYNVRTFGATGNGVVDDGPAINSAVATASASGVGGIIYFPPGIYRVTRPVTGIGSVILSNAHDLVFLGDGFASQIAMIGSSSSADWYMFRIRNGTSRIKFLNLSFSSQITFKDPSEQNHYINISGVSGDPNGGPNNIEVVGCYPRFVFGDAVRTLADAGQTIRAITVMYNDFDMTASRSCVEAQRFTDTVNVSFNFLTGSQDNQIDFEPTGGDGPTSWTIVGNHVEHSTSAAAAITIAGAGNNPIAHNNRRLMLAFNTITNGGQIAGAGIIGADIIGNIVTVNQNQPSSTASLIDLFQRVQYVNVIGNVCISQSTVNNRLGIRITSAVALSAPAQFCTVCDNIVTVEGSECQGIGLADTSEMVVDGNIIVADTSVATVSAGITATSIGEVVDHITSSGNLIVGITNELKFAFHYNCSGLDLRNVVANYNYVRNAFSLAFMSRTAAELFLDWRNVNGNNCVAMAGAPIQGPGTLEGVTLDGAAGPGTQFTFIQTALGPEGRVTAPVGSVGLNGSGGQATVLWMKETGVGVTGGQTGWVQQGASELCMGAQSVGTGTASVFLAPGTGLVAAMATELQFVIGRSGTLRNMRVTCGAGTGAALVTYRVRRNAANTSLTAVLSNLATAGSGSGTATVVAGDRISVSVAKNAVVATNQTNVAVTFELT